MADQISEALDIAAEETTGRQYGSWHAAADNRSLRREANRLRRSIIRFLENVPDDLMVIELRDALATQQPETAKEGE